MCKIIYYAIKVKLITIFLDAHEQRFYVQTGYCCLMVLGSVMLSWLQSHVDDANPLPPRLLGNHKGHH